MNAATEINSTTIAAHRERLEAAFGLVCPSRRGGHWKDRIDALVRDEDLARVGVTLDDIDEAVEFFTATQAQRVELFAGDRIEACRPVRDGAPLFRHTPAKERGIPLGYYIAAKGYRAGPAGDF